MKCYYNKFVHLNFSTLEYLDSLNDSQKQAVLNIQGPTMVIAGAGSGKTRVLTSRITHLLYNGISPFEVLSLTFTNKAAREMKNRIANVVGESVARNLWMGTFHSIFAKILRIESEKIGYPSNFTIYDTDDAKNLIKSIIKEYGLDDKVYKPGLVYNRISMAKNNLISPEAYKQNPTIQNEDSQSAKPRLGEIYATYNLRCFKAGAMDFDDLLFKTNILLRDHTDVLYKYQEKFKYLLVDEFQDTNFSQYLILKKLAARHENICVVGDDAQSIYAFRGANIQNILNFKKDYPDVKIFKLEQNYRSTKNIVHAANSIIAKNKNQLPKEVWTSNEEGNKIKVLKAITDNEEGLQVANEIFTLSNALAVHPNNFAILYRTNAQSRAMEEALRKLNIPYKIYGGISFYQRKEIKDLIAYLRLTINKNDEEALKRVINYPKRGIGQTSVDKLLIAANNAQVSLFDVVKNPVQYNAGIGGATLNKLDAFATMIDSFALKAKSSDAYEVASHVAQITGILKELYADKSPEGVSRYENIQELLNGVKDFTDRDLQEGESNKLPDFLQDIALLTDSDTQDTDDDHVSLMTIHTAKGLEFPYVFIVGMEENLFPSQLSINSQQDLEEERRLFYVALTRAEKKCYITYALNRYKWGNLINSEPSRFIEEIDAKYLELPLQQTPGANLRSRTAPIQAKTFGTSAATKSFQQKTQSPIKKVLSPKATPNTTPQGNFTPSDPNKLQAGMSVIHQRFGKGKILTIEGNFPDKKATIFFTTEGEKTILLKYAKLQIAEE